MDQHYGFLLIRASQEHIPLPGCWQRGLFQQEKCDSEAAEAGSEPREEVGARQEAGSCISKDWRGEDSHQGGTGKAAQGMPCFKDGNGVHGLDRDPSCPQQLCDLHGAACRQVRGHEQAACSSAPALLLCSPAVLWGQAVGLGSVCWLCWASFSRSQLGPAEKWCCSEQREENPCP